MSYSAHSRQMANELEASGFNDPDITDEEAYAAGRAYVSGRQCRHNRRHHRIELTDLKPILGRRRRPMAASKATTDRLKRAESKCVELDIALFKLREELQYLQQHVIDSFEDCSDSDRQIAVNDYRNKYKYPRMLDQLGTVSGWQSKRKFMSLARSPAPSARAVDPCVVYETK